MASPQLENGYTRIANELLDALSSLRLPGQEWQIVLAIIRKTYGFGRKEDKVSFGQIAQATGIPRGRVIMRVKSLVSKMVLGSLNGGTRQPRILWINKDFSKWLPSPKKETSPKIETIPSPQIESKPSPKIETHKRKKEIERNIYIEPLLGEFENVKLCQKEFDKLVSKFGEVETKKRIETLSEYMASKGKKYNSHYATILSWARRKEGRDQQDDWKTRFLAGNS